MYSLFNVNKNVCTLVMSMISSLLYCFFFTVYKLFLQKKKLICKGVTFYYITVYIFIYEATYNLFVYSVLNSSKFINTYIHSHTHSYINKTRIYFAIIYCVFIYFFC